MTTTLKWIILGCVWLEGEVEWNGSVPSSSDGMSASYVWLEGWSCSIFMFGWRDWMDGIIDWPTPLTMGPTCHANNSFFPFFVLLRLVLPAHTACAAPLRAPVPAAALREPALLFACASSRSRSSRGPDLAHGSTRLPPRRLHWPSTPSPAAWIWPCWLRLQERWICAAHGSARRWPHWLRLA